MTRFNIRRGSYANVTSTLALIAALGTGGAYAAATIGSAEIIDNSVASVDIKNGTIGPADLHANARNQTYAIHHKADVSLTSSWSRVLTVLIPVAGTYNITAKATAKGFPVDVDCSLVTGAGADFDTTGVWAAGTQAWIPLYLQANRTFTSGSSAGLDCRSGSTSSSVDDIKIMAVRVDSLVNTAG